MQIHRLPTFLVSTVKFSAIQGCGGTPAVVCSTWLFAERTGHERNTLVDEAVAWAASLKVEVIVKPPESSGCEGVFACCSEADIRQAFQSLGMVNIEGSVNPRAVCTCL